jgi:hypothetical protein
MTRRAVVLFGSDIAIIQTQGLCGTGRTIDPIEWFIGDRYRTCSALRLGALTVAAPRSVDRVACSKCYCRSPSCEQIIVRGDRKRATKSRVYSV